MLSTRRPLWKISISTSTDAEDATAELLSSIFAIPAAAYTDVETKQTTISAYVPKVLPSQLAALRAGLRAITDAGLNSTPSRVHCRKIRRENWAESWKRHFKPLEISPRLLLKPSWSTRKPKPGQALVVLDPGLSFGTGHHPTTSFCLEQIAALSSAASPHSLLDVGCGSGILAIAAAKLGYKPIEAFDFDPEAVRVARANAASNGVRIHISRRDLTKLPQTTNRRFDLICANLIYDLLISERDKLLNRLAPEGTLVVAGILGEQFGKVERAFRKSNLKLVADRHVGEWRSGSFRRI